VHFSIQHVQYKYTENNRKIKKINPQPRIGCRYFYHIFAKRISNVIQRARQVFETASPFYLCFARVRVKRRFRISNISAGHMTLRRGQHDACELLVGRARTGGRNIFVKSTECRGTACPHWWRLDARMEMNGLICVGQNRPVLEGAYGRTDQQRSCSQRTIINIIIIIIIIMGIWGRLSSSSSSPLCRVFILRQTMSLGNTVLQPFCCSYSWCILR
jgi:hypothetical protein